jgi:putative transposase
VHDTFPQYRDFEWQEGYGAFSLGISGVDETLKYIANQPDHHRKLTFRDEVIQFLKKHGMEYDDEMLE